MTDPKPKDAEQKRALVETVVGCDAARIRQDGATFTVELHSSGFVTGLLKTGGTGLLALEQALSFWRRGIPDDSPLHLDQSDPPKPDPQPCSCEAVKWNPSNRVTQCHRCGRVVPLMIEQSENFSPDPQPDGELREGLARVICADRSMGFLPNTSPHRRDLELADAALAFLASRGYKRVEKTMDGDVVDKVARALGSAWAALGDNLESRAAGGTGITKEYTHAVQREIREAETAISAMRAAGWGPWWPVRASLAVNRCEDCHGNHDTGECKEAEARGWEAGREAAANRCETSDCPLPVEVGLTMRQQGSRVALKLAEEIRALKRGEKPK